MILIMHCVSFSNLTERINSSTKSRLKQSYGRTIKGGRRLSELNKKSSVGNDLLSQGLAPQLPSALKGLTTGFGMGLGVPPSLTSPTELLFSY